MPALRVDAVHKRFGGKPVLDGISFTAAEGDILSVIGPSGCGKTTLFRCILGEIATDSGRIFLDDKDISDLPTEKRGVGIVYQGYALFPHMTAFENVAYGLRAARRPREATRRRVEEMLDLVQLGKKGGKYPAELSGGERQRVALARALAVEPRILLLDEAFAALDATTRSDVVHEVRDIIRKTRVTTLLITHDQEEAFLFSRHVLVMNEGRVVTTGSPDEVMSHDHPFIQEFVKMILLARSRVQEDVQGEHFVLLEGGQRVPVSMPGLDAGDNVHVMIKKGPAQKIEVWRYAED